MKGSFPEVWNSSKWEIVKNREDYWLKLSNGDRKLAGHKTIYRKIGQKDEAVLEINLFNRGAVIQVWFQELDSSNEKIQSRIMKNHCWAYGAMNKKVAIEALVSGVDNEVFWGVRIMLKTDSGKIATEDIYKKGREPKLGELPENS